MRLTDSKIFQAQNEPAQSRLESRCITNGITNSTARIEADEVVVQRAIQHAECKISDALSYQEPLNPARMQMQIQYKAQSVVSEIQAQSQALLS